MSARAVPKSKSSAATPPRARSLASPRTPSGPLLRCALALVVLVLAAYANSLGNGFVWDDHQQIVLNGNLRPSTPLSRLVTADTRFDPHAQGVQGVDYRPLQMLTYRTVLAGFGPEPAAFHAVSLLFTLACALASFALALQLLGAWKPAFALAALFALDPIHTEATDWIAALPDLGATLFVLLAFSLYLTARARRGVDPKPTLRFAALAAASFFLALLWKESALIFPLLVIAFELLASGVDRLTTKLQRALLAAWPSFAVLALHLALRFAVLGGLEPGRRDWQLSPALFALNGLWLLTQYVAKLTLPFNLNAYVVFHPIRSLAEARSLAALLLALPAMAAFVLTLQLSKSPSPTAVPSSPRPALHPPRLALFGVAWVVLALLPALDLRALGRNAFAERYLFLASFGFCLLLVVAVSAALARLPARIHRYAAPSLVAAVLLAFFLQIVLRNPDWKDDATLFPITLAQSPDSPFLHLMVATAQSADPNSSDSASPPADPSRGAAAEANFRSAIELAQRETPPDRPDFLTASRGLAWIFANRGQVPQALATLDAAAKLDPDNADTDAERGLILLRSGNAAAAAPLLERALAAEPDNENVLSGMGLLARETEHDPARAVALFQQALAAHPAEDDFAASLHNNLAGAYADLANWPAAIAQEREAIRILPQDPGFHINLAGALASTGHRDEARTEAFTALQLAPSNPAAEAMLNSLSSRPATPSR